MTTCLPPGSRMITSGRIRRSPSPSVTVCCSSKSQCSDHAGQLDHALQLQLAPAAADARPLERVHELAGLGAQILAGGVERGDALQQLRAGLDAPTLGFPDLAVHVAERFRHRRQQVLDGHLALVDVGRGRRAGLAQPRFGQVEKRLVVALERFVAQRAKRVPQRSRAEARRGRA